MIDMLFYQLLGSTNHGKTQKYVEKIDLRYQLLWEVINSKFLMNDILYQIFKNLLGITSKSMKQYININISIYQ